MKNNSSVVNFITNISAVKNKFAKTVFKRVKAKSEIISKVKLGLDVQTTTARQSQYNTLSVRMSTVLESMVSSFQMQITRDLGFLKSFEFG